jgi:hypothetical protein
MKCLRCGYCCTSLLAVVVDDPEIGITPENLITIGRSGEKERCKHLRGEAPGEYSCAVHDRPWYPETPCAAYQSHWPSVNCRMGDYLLARHKEGKAS